jgi:hypothetical protein
MCCSGFGASEGQMVMDSGSIIVYRIPPHMDQLTVFVFGCMACGLGMTFGLRCTTRHNRTAQDICAQGEGGSLLFSYSWRRS